MKCSKRWANCPRPERERSKVFPKHQLIVCHGRELRVQACCAGLIKPARRKDFDSTHIHGTRVPVEEPATASEAVAFRYLTYSDKVVSFQTVPEFL